MTYQLECKKDGLRQTQDGLWKLTLTVHPNDMPDEILKAPMGKHYIAVFAEYDADNPQAERRKFEDMPRSQQAGMLCHDENFQKWLSVDGNDNAAWEVRSRCAVGSRAELDNDSVAAQSWDAIVRKYRSQMGLVI